MVGDEEVGRGGRVVGKHVVVKREALSERIVASTCVEESGVGLVAADERGWRLESVEECECLVELAARGEGSYLAENGLQVEAGRRWMVD